MTQDREEPVYPKIEFLIEPIINSINETEIENFKPVYERYYEEKFCIAFSKKERSLDTLLRIHTNKLILLYLAKGHDIIKNQKQIKELNFNISMKNGNCRPKGKSKKGAQLLNPESIICLVKCEDDTEYPIYSGVRGKLIEVNDLILRNPNLLVTENIDNGFLGIILPDLKQFKPENYLSKEEYEKYFL